MFIELYLVDDFYTRVGTAAVVDYSVDKELDCNLALVNTNHIICVEYFTNDYTIIHLNKEGRRVVKSSYSELMLLLKSLGC